AGDKEAGRFEERERAVAHQRQIQIARARPFTVERLRAIPPPAGERAAAQHDRCTRRNHFFNDAAELAEPRRVAAERQSNDVVALFLVRQPTLNGVGGVRCSHTPRSFKDRAEGAPAGLQVFRSQKKHNWVFTFVYQSEMYRDGLSISPSTHTSVWPIVGGAGSKIITPLRFPILEVFGNCWPDPYRLLRYWRRSRVEKMYS